LAICVASSVWGVGIVGLGLAPNLALAVAGLAVAGGADMVSGLFRMTMWNQTIPDALRGRMASIELVSYSAGPLLGNTEAGLAAAAIGVQGSIVAGGVLCVVGVAAVAAALPRFVAYRSPAEAVGGEPGAGVGEDDLERGVQVGGASHPEPVAGHVVP
jgi:hypothetical protein